VSKFSTSVIVLVLLLAGCSDSDPSPRDRLAERLARLEDPSIFTLRYSAGGTDVLDCVVAHREFTLTVDAEQGTLDVVDREGGALAKRTADGTWLAAGAFVGPVSGSWVVLDGADDEIVMQVAGSDLAGYLLADGLPASGPQYVRGLLEEARTVSSRGDDRWRLGFADSAESGIGGLTVDVALGPRKVQAVVVSGSTGGEVPAGFTMTFVDQPVSVVVRNPTSLSVLRPDAARPAAQSSCEL
jgi:hypothetical protein